MLLSCCLMPSYPCPAAQPASPALLHQCPWGWQLPDPATAWDSSSKGCPEKQENRHTPCPHCLALAKRCLQAWGDSRCPMLGATRADSESLRPQTCTERARASLRFGTNTAQTQGPPSREMSKNLPQHPSSWKRAAASLPSGSQERRCSSSQHGGCIGKRGQAGVVPGRSSAIGNCGRLWGRSCEGRGAKHRVRGVAGAGWVRVLCAASSPAKLVPQAAQTLLTALTALPSTARRQTANSMALSRLCSGMSH